MNEPRPIAVLETQLLNQVDELKKILPANIPPEKFISVVKTAVIDNPNLIAANRASLFRACRRCAQEGLLPDGHEAALVLFKDQVQYLPMYSGLLKQFRNSGQFRHVNTGIVYEGEEFDHWIDEDGEHFRHRPGDDRDPAKVRRVYATATTKDGAFFIVDMSKSEVDKHKKQSRATRDDAPWRQWEQAMQRKTALRVLSKLLPKSSDLERALIEDEKELYGVESPNVSATSGRPSDTRMALDAFGAADLGESTVPEGGGMDEAGSPDVPPATERKLSAAHGDESHPPNSLFSTGEQVAFERGKKDRGRGAKRSGVPGEYREGDDAAAMALAWQRGWDEGGK